MRSIRYAGLAALLVAATAGATPLPRFPPNAVWHRNISTAPLAQNSAAMISRLNALGGWGNGNKFQIDFSILVVNAPPGSVPTKAVIPVSPSPADGDPGGYYSPDCDAPGFAFPLPAGGAIEGTADYTSCDNHNDDCHLLVVQGTKLYEAYNAKSTASGLEARCAIKWDLTKVYPPEGRGEQCTTADAAGFPITPLLFNADEVYNAMQVQNGDLGHAIRFILPPVDRPSQGILGRIAHDVYVHPGTHAGGPGGPSDSVPYAARLRLHTAPAFDISNYNPAAQVILRTMQRYGIVLADGGNIALTAEDDRYDTHKWADLGITAQTFNPGVGNPAVKVTDFDVIETGAQIPLTYDCVRVPDDFIFIDHFQY